MVFWIFLLFFCNFLLRDGLERNRTIFFIFSLSQPLPTYCGLKWSHYGISFNILNFLAIFLEFCITRRAGTKGNNNFYFLSFLAFSSVFWLEMKSEWNFLIFWIFLLFFLNYVLRMWLERNGTITFIFSRSWPFLPYFFFKRCHNGIF